MVNQKWILYFLIIASTLATSCSGNKRSTKQKTTTSESASRKVQEKYAEILGVSASQLKNRALYQFIDHWYSTPYQYGGNSTNGVDCSGFVHMLYKSVYHKTVPRTTKEISKEVKRVSKKNLSEGDVLFFDIEGKKHAHVGIYLLNNYFVHASSSKGVIISSLTNPYYEKTFSEAGRF